MIKLLFILFPMFCFSQNVKIEKEKISMKLELEIIERKAFLNDSLYICKNDIRVRITKDSVYIYANRQYLKFKK